MSNEVSVGKNAALTKKDIFTIPNSIILHICNIAGGFGSGFAGQIAEKYPFVKDDYKELYKEGKLSLGTFSKHQRGHRVFINLYAMPDYHRKMDDYRCYLDYDALDSALFNLSEESRHFKGFVPVLPYRMGAGNAGGDWTKVTKLLDKHLEFYVVCLKDS